MSKISLSKSRLNYKHDNKVLITTLASLIMFGTAAIASQDNQLVNTATADPVATCMATKSTLPVSDSGKKGPIKVVAHALGGEFANDSKNMLRDSILVFSAQDIDPYDRRTPKDGRPYTLCQVQLVDGSMASVIKYPDGSGKVVGGFADGTIIAPSGQNTFIVAYPNGVRGKMIKTGSTYKIYRPDDSITTIKKTMSGDYQISNDKIGTMGTARTDQLGMQYEFNTSTF